MGNMEDDDSKLFTETEKLGTSIMFIFSMFVMGVATTASILFQTWAFIVGASIFCVPFIVAAVRRVNDKRWGE